MQYLTDNTRITGLWRPPPNALYQNFPLHRLFQSFCSESQNISDIIQVVNRCSRVLAQSDPLAAIEYAEKLKNLESSLFQLKIIESLFPKPRTTIGWKV